MSKLYKSIFNVNGCTVVKQEQTDTTVTITVRLTKGNASRCGCCGRKGKLYDNGLFTEKISHTLMNGSV